MSSLKHLLYKLNAKVLVNVGNDLRKAGYLIGIGFVGLLVPTQDISVQSAIALLLWGAYSWTLGHIFLYMADKLASKSENGDEV